MASSAGFEPTAFRLGGGRSILLSYEDTVSDLKYDRVAFDPQILYRIYIVKSR